MALLETAARAAGEIARRRFRNGYKSWNKEGGSPVTEADLEIDVYLRETLLAARPAYGWLSEESADDPARLSRQDVFIVDPLDGTVAFLKGRPHFTICIAVVRGGEPRAGVVYNPMLDDLYIARSGAGALRNATPIRVSGRAALEGCTMLGDRIALTRAPWPAMTIEARNSVAYRLALVAEGSFDAAVSLSGKRDWDLAAAEIIVREAGGSVTDRQNLALRYNRPDTLQPSFVAANPILIQEITRKIPALRQ